MKKTLFTEQHRISAAKPTNLTTSRVTVINFATSINTFLEENFHGAVEMDFDSVMKNPGFITLCPEYVAYFLKLLLVYLDGKDMLYVKMECDSDDKLVLRIDSPGFKNFTGAEFCDVVRAAKGTQFIPYETEGGFVLKKPYKISCAMSLYSTSSTVMRDELYRIFFAGYDDENNLNFFKNLKRK